MSCSRARSGKDDLTFTIKNVGTANYDVTVMPVNNETIDGKSNVGLVPPTSAPSVVKIVAQGGLWWIVAQG